MQRFRNLFLICILTFLPLLGSAESDVSGWGQTKWGMSHSEVKKHYELGPWEPGAAPICKLAKKIRIWEHDFTVALYFDEQSVSGKLFKVVLVHFNDFSADTAWLTSIKDLLVDKYGNPVSFEINGNMKVSRWLKSDGQLKLTTLTDKTVMCAVEYVSVSLEGNKL